MPLIQQNLKYLSFMRTEEENEMNDEIDFDVLPYNRVLFEDLPEQEFARYNLVYLRLLVIILIYRKRKKLFLKKMIYLV